MTPPAGPKPNPSDQVAPSRAASMPSSWLITRRLAVDLLLYTAQRSGDVRVMGRQNVRDGRIKVRQEKTREFVDMPIHRELQKSLDAAPLGQLTFIVTQAGEPFTAKGFGNWISAAAKEAGLPPGAAAHGLRKAAARRLAEAGASAHEIMAVTGYRTLKEVERYTRTAAMKGLATSAMAGQNQNKRCLTLTTS